MRQLLLSIAISIGATTSMLADTKEFEALANEGGRNFQSKEGQRYEAEFEKVFFPVFTRALRECNNEPDTKEPATLVFVVAADGRVKRLLNSPDISFGDCVAAKLRVLRTLPKPPQDNWVISFAAANHHHEYVARKQTEENAPHDQPTHLATTKDRNAYEKAIAPYVEKARATYPAAKKRFLAGLPPGHIFGVRLRLTDSDGVFEDAFVDVERIEGHEITGTIANKLGLVREYKNGQRITFPEEKIDNWLIVRPDGTEEGNYVGKFIDQQRRH